MTALVTQRLRGLADTIADLKVRVRAAIATELGQAVGIAVRDVLVIALATREIEPYRTSRPGAWGGPGGTEAWDREADRWDEPTHYSPGRNRDDPESDPDSTPVPAAVAVAVGFQVGRWWLARRGNLTGAIGAGVLAAALGLTGGAAVRAALAVLAATADVLTATAVLQHRDPELSGDRA